MRKFRFYISLISIFFIFSAAFAENHYVCVGSYKQKTNAEEFLKKLEGFNVSAFLNQVELKDGTHYRVLLSPSIKSKDEAKAYRKEVLTFPFVHHLNVTGIWVCGGEKIQVVAENNPLPEIKETIQLPENSIILKENEIQEIPVSEEKPYSVLVRSYKEEQKAVTDQKRLEENDIDSYILKTYDEDTYFSFDLHSGAFKTPEEAKPLQEKLETIGIENTQLSDFEEIKDKIEKYDEVIKNETVVYEDGNSEIPEMLSPAVQQVVRQFPINKNFQIEKIEIFDFDNMRSENETLPSLENELYVFEETDEIHAASIATYKDDLYGKDIKIIIASGENFEEIKAEDAEKLKFKVTDGVLDCLIFEEDGKFVLYGKNPENSMAVLMEADDFTREEFIDFINDSTNDSGLLAYPQLRKTLMVLPDENSDVKRTFTKFKLSRVEQSYAEERNNAEWALAIVGHWHSAAYLLQNSKEIEIGFYDLDYDYNARQVHEMFMSEKIKNETGHHSKVKNCISWYLPSFWARNEVSFSTKSYVIALDSFGLEEDGLVDAADDLKIWNEVSKDSNEFDAK